MPLKRVLEPEVMESAEEAAEYDAMDHRDVNSRFVADLLQARTALSKNRPPADPMDEQNAEQPAWEVLDLGCGTALIPIELCEQSSDARVMAVDLSVAMLDLARLNVEAAGLIESIQLAREDVKQLPFETNAFDAVISNAILHHLAEPQEMLSEAARIVRPGGLLFVRDLLRPEDEAELERILDRYAGDETDHARQMFRDSLHAALTLDELRAIVRQLGYDESTVKATSDRHWTWSAKGA